MLRRGAPDHGDHRCRATPFGFDIESVNCENPIAKMKLRKCKLMQKLKFPIQFHYFSDFQQLAKIKFANIRNLKLRNGFDMGRPMSNPNETVVTMIQHAIQGALETSAFVKELNIISKFSACGGTNLHLRSLWRLLQ